jgi:ribosomal protein S7
MLPSSTKKIVNLVSKKNILLNKISLNSSKKIQTEFINIQSLFHINKPSNNYKNVIFNRNDLKKKNEKISYNLLKQIFKKRNKNIKLKIIKKKIVEEICSRNISNFEINLYSKKLIVSFLSYYNLQIKRLKHLLKKKKHTDLIVYIHKHLISKKDLSLLKNFLFILNTRPKFYTKNEFLIQKQFLYFLLKHKKNISYKRERIYLNALLVAFFKQNKNIKISKKKISNYKTALQLTYPTKKKSESNSIYKKLVGLMIKNGKKSSALKLIEKGLLKTSLKLKMPINLILRKVFNSLKTSIESKKIRVRRSYHFVPFPVNLKRKVYLAVKWVLFGTKKSKLKVSFDLKLHLELIKILKTKKSIPFKNKKYNIFKSLQNKSNAHFRW